MPLPQLATSADVAATLGRVLTAQELVFCARLLDFGSALVRKYTRLTLTQVIGDTITIPGNWSQVLPLPQRPVTNVTSVSVNGNGWSAGQQYTVSRYGELLISTGAYMPDFGASLYGSSQLWGPAGSNHGPYTTGNNWQGPGTAITVVYDHGYAVIPDEIANVVAGMVALQIGTGVGVIRERIGFYQVEYTRSESGGLALTPEDKSILNDFRKRAISSSISKAR